MLLAFEPRQLLLSPRQCSTGMSATAGDVQSSDVVNNPMLVRVGLRSTGGPWCR